MPIEDVFSKRRQIRYYDQKLHPSQELVEELLKKTYELVPSKQSLMPYNVHVLQPKHEEEKQILYHASTHCGTLINKNAYAPYVLFFTPRLAFPNDSVLGAMHRDGRFNHHCTNPNNYNNETQLRESAIEIGMFCAILSGLCVEAGLQVSYLLCYKTEDLEEKFEFLDNEKVIFSMQLGYKNSGYYPKKYEKPPREEKPDYDEIINWIE